MPGPPAAHVGSRARAEVTCREGHPQPQGLRSPCAPPPQPQGLYSPCAPPPTAPGSALTMCPPPRISVRLFRQVSLSVSPHLRSSASTVKALLSQGWKHRSSPKAQRPPARFTLPSPPPVCPPRAGVVSWRTRHWGSRGGPRCSTYVQPRLGKDMWAHDLKAALSGGTLGPRTLAST